MYGTALHAMLLLTFLAGEADPGAEVLKKVNAARKEAGVQPVVLDATLSRACKAHARYLTRHFDPAKAASFNPHVEDSSLPGYTKEGDAAARKSEITITTGDGPTNIPAGVDQLLACFFHRIDLIHPDLRQIGFGHAVENKHTVVVIDDHSGRSPRRGKEPPPISFPEKATNVPLAFAGNEYPNPIPPEGKGKKPGFPITVSFPGAARVRAASLVLEDAAGASIPGWLSSPEKPAAQPKYQKNTICLIPKDVLQPATTYRVKAQAIVNGKKWTRTWSFTTRD